MLHVIHFVLSSMTMVRCAADGCTALPSMSASVILAVVVKLAAKAWHGKLRMMRFIESPFR